MILSKNKIEFIAVPHEAVMKRKDGTLFPALIKGVDLSDGKKGLSVLNKGLPEFTIKEDSKTIELTLFRSVEWVAEDINSRLGDAGPKIYTPDAQCLRQMKFHYALYPHKGDYQEGNVVKIADEYNTEPILVQTIPSHGKLPSSTSFIKVINEDYSIKITGMKFCWMII